MNEAHEAYDSGARQSQPLGANHAVGIGLDYLGLAVYYQP
jgi:hypothetical protein